MRSNEYSINAFFKYGEIIISEYLALYLYKNEKANWNNYWLATSVEEPNIYVQNVFSEH